MMKLKTADRPLNISLVVIGCSLLLAACDPQSQGGDVMKGGGGDVTDEEAAAELMTALHEGRAWVCADSGLQQTAVDIISEKLNRMVAGDTMPTRVMSTSESVQVAFDAQTKRMVCRSEMFTMNGEYQNTRDVTWTAQPTADGFTINVGVDMSQFYSAAQAPFYGG
ncbi:MAG TPA: hypothetical protein VD906_02280 [Caulobacteraceae bacterium]|nr:hypothetical protein [Caulobacteraceae bacterium]